MNLENRPSEPPLPGWDLLLDVSSADASIERRIEWIWGGIRAITRLCPLKKKVEERKQKIAESMKPQDGKGECERECVQGQISHPQSHVLFTSVRLCLTSDYILPRETIKSFCQRLFNRNATLNHSLSLSHLTSGNCTAGRMSTDGFSIYQSNVLEISTHTWMNSDCYLFKCYGKQVSIIHMINLS